MTSSRASHVSWTRSPIPLSKSSSGCAKKDTSAASRSCATKSAAFTLPQGWEVSLIFASGQGFPCSHSEGPVEENLGALSQFVELIKLRRPPTFARAVPPPPTGPSSAILSASERRAA
jgi:hypothetical protein